MRHYSDRRRGVNLQLEALENRCCPSALSALAVHGSTLVVKGDNTANNVAITDDGQGNVTATMDGKTVTGSGIRTIIVNTRGGDDVVSYTWTGSLTADQHLVLHLGKGDDQVLLDASQGMQASRVKIDLHGNDGDDQVTAKLGAVDGTNFFLNANLGKGDDLLDVTLANMLVNQARVRFHVHGHKGNDTMAFHATDLKIDDGAALTLFLKGSQDADTINVDYKGMMHGLLKLRADGNQGKDVITANAILDPGSTGTINALVNGNQGNDELTLNLDDQSGIVSTVNILRALIDGKQGQDTAFHSENVDVVRVETDNLITPPAP